MEKDVVAVHLPVGLTKQVDVVAPGELRSRANMVRLLVTDGLQRREPVEPKES